MAASSSVSLLLALKTLFIGLMCIMVVALAYTILMNEYSSCFDLSAWWTKVVVTDFFIFITFTVVCELISFASLRAWFFYKESSWIKTVIFIIMECCCGGFVTCGYIAMLLFKLSPEESLKDPLYFVLARHHNRDATGHMMRSSVVTVKVIVTAIGCCMLGIIIYAYILDGFPSYAELLIPCMIANLIDLIIHTVVFSVWIAYKESSWIKALLWILLLVCFSGIGVCVYIIRELFYLSPGQPISFILFNRNNRDMSSCDPLLTLHSDV